MQPLNLYNVTENCLNFFVTAELLNSFGDWHHNHLTSHAITNLLKFRSHGRFIALGDCRSRMAVFITAVIHNQVGYNIETPYIYSINTESIEDSRRNTTGIFLSSRLSVFLSEIRDSHGSGYQDCRLLGCD